MTPYTQRVEKRQYFPALDGLRALAVLGVFLHHYAAQLLPEWLRFGWVGVDVFFVLSGFLITGILFDSRDRARRWRDFYLRRTLRIFPLFYGVLLLLLVTTPLAHWRWSWSWLSMPAYVYNLAPVQIKLTSNPAAFPVVVAQTTTGFLVTICASSASYRWFEQPFLRLKDRWTHQPPVGATVEILRREQNLLVKPVH